MTQRPMVALIAAALLLGGCSGDDGDPPGGTSASPSSSSPAASPPSGDPGADARVDDPALDAGLSEPVEDRVYPRVGDPGVDALHYDLDLTWDPDGHELTATEELTFRATADDDAVVLDLAPGLAVDEVAVDGEATSSRRRGKNLVVATDVVADQRYLLRLSYSGTPQPVEAPTTRADVPGLGWTVTDGGAVWTMQEPFGAYTWYAVNDQPSDKALYDLTLTVPSPMVGVSNGELLSRTDSGGSTVTEWHLADPAASYLVTVAFGDYVTDEVTSGSGVPISLWVPQEESIRMAGLRENAVAAVDWAEDVLGDYPFDTLGFLFVDSTSGMETQTMITLGVTDYTFSMPVLVHEVVHQWWGDQVTPRDWRDVWMNEGMTMYLQAMWEAENGGPPLGRRMAEWAAGGQELRDTVGPPAAYDPARFAEPNVYYLPAVMWHQVRGRLGDRRFFRLVRQWPARAGGTAGYADVVRWWSSRSGTELAPLFRAHLLGSRQPAA